jgi:SAM-dependent methyltransferase
VTHPDAERWNARYVADGEAWLEYQPRQLLLDHADLLPKRGLALDVAAGVANNGTYLARRGLHVVALDISKIALQLALQRASSESLPLAAAVYDLSHLWLPVDSFDVIVNFHFLERATFPVFRQALKPGGLIIFETLLRSDNNTPTPDYYLEPGELLSAFSDYEIIHWKERTIPETTKVTAQLVARKPDAMK